MMPVIHLAEHKLKLLHTNGLTQQQKSIMPVIHLAEHCKYHSDGTMMYTLCLIPEKFLYADAALFNQFNHNM